MKIGLDAGPSWLESCLPVEIIAQIILHLARWTESEESKTSSYTLWACCLVSHDWYRVAISFLYQRPRLVNKNFDFFARTMCPPINAHVGNLGLEKFVRELNMGGLAYESKNSLTARLLGRVGPSLERFVAPSVSFGISCFAPLSRCVKLEDLDLSKIYQPLDVVKLLRSIRNLGKLSVLRLPDTAVLPSDTKLQHGSWPPKLRELSVTGWIFQGAAASHTSTSFPSSLIELTITHCKSCPLFMDRDGYDVVKAPNIRSLTLQNCPRALDDRDLLRIFTIYPSMLSLTLPAQAMTRGVPDMNNIHVPLENLELTMWEDHEYLTPSLYLEPGLMSCVRNLPRLWQVILHQHCVSPASPKPLIGQRVEEELAIILKQRARERNQEVGYEEIELEEAGFFNIFN